MENLRTNFFFTMDKKSENGLLSFIQALGAEALVRGVGDKEQMFEIFQKYLLFKAPNFFFGKV